MGMGNKKYGLTINIPSENIPNAYSAICSLESDEPFPTIQKGDLIDPRAWEGASFDKYMELYEYGDVLKVESIYHHIGQEKDGSYGQHYIDVFTKIVRKYGSKK